MTIVLRKKKRSILSTILARYGASTDLRITAVNNPVATSTGPVTIADGGSVEVQPDKTWSIS